MRELLLLAVHLILTLAKLLPLGDVRSFIAESLLLKHQLIDCGCSRRRAPPLTTLDRFVLGLTTMFVRPQRVEKLAAILKPATLLRFHKALVDRKYRRLFASAGTRRKPGPKGPTKDHTVGITEIKQGTLLLKLGIIPPPGHLRACAQRNGGSQAQAGNAGNH